jgi:hypothetical protein
MPLIEGRNTARQIAEVIEMPVGAGKKIFEGSLVVLNAGYAEMGSTATGLMAAGRAETYADNTGGLAGDVTVRIRRGCFLFANSATDAVDQADILKDCYVEDDQTVAATDGTGTKSKAGKVISLTPEGVWVEIL